MSQFTTPGRPSRRSILLGGAGAVTVVALSRRGSGSARAVQPATAQLSGAQLVSSLNQTPDVHLAATDGWVNIAGREAPPMPG